MKKHLIDDVPGSRAKELKNTFRDFDIVILDAEQMTKDLLTMPLWQNADQWRTLIILPGNGANIVRRYIETLDRFWLWQWPWKAFPPAKRIWMPGQSPVALTSRISNGFYAGLKLAIIIDDVVSSGETCRKLRKLNLPHLPNVEWQIATWARQESANTNGFAKIYACRTVGETTGKAPINSLSTLLQVQDIAKSYALRNFGNRADSFLQLLEDCR
ncbi:MAG: hypothetical protein ACOYUZ_04760 [Patescibacteria group bacterium]